MMGVFMSDSEILELRRQARIAKRQQDAVLIALHRHAGDLLLDATRADELRVRALAQVDKWEQGALCNPRYVKAWRNLLRLPAEALRAAMLRLGRNIHGNHQVCTQ